jgi:GH24 family phage-related lysozyme (muramidase)
MATATLPLNSFKTKAFELTNTTQTIYTTPDGVTTIVLGAQVTKIGANPVTVKFTLVKNATEFVMLKDFEIPVNDACEVTTGKLVIESGASVTASAGANNCVNLVLSILETSNE